MARERVADLSIAGRLRAQSALHVGGLGPGLDADLELARDGQGRWLIPGSSLAGALRAWMEARAPAAFCPTVRALWGHVDAAARGSGGGKGAGGAASRVAVADAPVVGTVQPVLRDGVGIDRVTGAAAPRYRYTRAVLPPGTCLDCRIRVELGPGAHEAHAQAALWGWLLAAMRDEGLAVGAGRSKGLGWLRWAEPPQIRRLAWDGPEAVVRWIQDRGAAGECVSPEALQAEAPALVPRSPTEVTVVVGWEPLAPVMVAAAYVGMAADVLPFVDVGAGGEVRFCLPGTSLKGVLRSQAERIVRTLCPQAQGPTGAGTDPGDPSGFRRQLAVPLVRGIFGTVPEAIGGTAHTEPRPGRGALRVGDCHSLDCFREDAWNELIRLPPPDGADGPWSQAARSLPGHPSLATHVGIDRWTGGAATALLYTVLEPHGVQWEPLRMCLELERLPPKEHSPALALLWLLLLDLWAGRLPLGGQRNRGMGDIRVTRIEMEGPLGAGHDRCVWKRTDEEPPRLSPDLGAMLRRAWGEWIAATRAGQGVTGRTAS